MRLILLLMLVFAFAIPAHAAMNTGSDLLRACEIAVDQSFDVNITQAMEGGFCMGLAASFIDLDRVSGTDVKWCVPERVTVGQGIRVLLKYMNANPEKLHLNSIIVAALAFQSSFPCNE